MEETLKLCFVFQLRVFRTISGRTILATPSFGRFYQLRIMRGDYELAKVNKPLKIPEMNKNL